MKSFVISTSASMFLAVGAFAQPGGPSEPLRLLATTLSSTEDPGTQLNILRGMNAALKGKRDVQAPAGWAELYEKLKTSSNGEVRREAQTLAATFGGSLALEELRQTMSDSNQPIASRLHALETVVGAKEPDAVPSLLALLKEAGPLRSVVLRGLANFDAPRVPDAILQEYSALSSDEKRDALGTLLSRLPWARQLIAAIDQDKVDRTELSAPLARQMQDFKDPEIDAWLTKNWGAVRASSSDKQKEIAHYKTFLTPANFESADPQRGRALFAQTCLACHMMFGAGGKIGPELTGAYTDIDYLLQNILDPNAIIGKDYQQTIVRTKDGQMLSGVVTGEDGASVTLKTLAGSINVQRADVQELSVSPVSMMPEGLLSGMADDQIRDLFAYLRQHGQIPMLATPVNVNDFFNGADLSGWHPSSNAWRVEEGGIVGRGNPKRPEFLVSDLSADAFRFTAEIRLSGAKSSAEIAIRGQEIDGAFQGTSLSLKASEPVALWTYRLNQKPTITPSKVGVADGQWTPLEIVAQGRELRVRVNGQEAFYLSNAHGAPRSVLAFHVLGEGGELRIRQPKIELLGN